MFNSIFRKTIGIACLVGSFFWFHAPVYRIGEADAYGFTALASSSVRSSSDDWVQSKTYADVRAFMYELAAKHPDRVEIFKLGNSDSGEIIEGVKIGKGAINNLVVATHHGNEYGATEVGKAIAQSLAEDPIQGQTDFVIPVLNIAGFNNRDRREPVGQTTYDPNRDYPGPCGTEGPFHLQSTKALADFVAAKNIVTSATLHTFYPVVAYPWGIPTHDLSTEYDDQFIQLAKASTVESKYPVGNSTQAIYPAAGAYEDYAFWKHGIWSLLFELGYSHSPDDNAVRELIRVNVPGIRRFLTQAPTLRAEHHEFNGKCDELMRGQDRHNE